MCKINDKLKTLPALPGIYIMKSSSGEVIYVGKSKMLKNRVRQYFQNKGHTAKVAAMVENIDDFEYIVTDTETEALILECNLIKKYKPYYNILLKDSKQYPYIKLTLNQPFPKILLARKISNDNAKYYGPFTGGVARDTIEVIRKIFKIPNCNKVFPRDIGKTRQCLNYHINLCIAPCSGNVSQYEYQCIFNDICDFLDGKTSYIIKRLKDDMNKAAENLEFEKAAEFRDKISKIESLGEKQKINVPGGKDTDVIAIISENNISNIQIFNIRNGILLGRNQIWVDFSLDEKDGEILSNFITQYYSESEFIPNEILVNISPIDCDTISAWLSELSGRGVLIKVPQKGYKSDIVAMAVKNCNRAIEDNAKIKIAQKEKNKSALENLSSALGFTLPLKRIESYDISNTGGQNSVGSMIVFENGVAQNSEYRHFKIKSVTNIDDYASTAEVITRRFKRYSEEEKTADGKFSKLPNAIFADGGLGHVTTIKNVVTSFGLNIPVFGMVKNVHHKTTSLITSDGEIITLPVDAFHLVCEIQEEVHRVAITHHRKANEKDVSRSSIDEIPGVGAKRKRALLRAFGSAKALKSANISDIAAVDGISLSVAEEIYKFYNE